MSRSRFWQGHRSSFLLVGGGLLLIVGLLIAFIVYLNNSIQTNTPGPKEASPSSNEISAPQDNNPELNTSLTDFSGIDGPNRSSPSLSDDELNSAQHQVSINVNSQGKPLSSKSANKTAVDSFIEVEMEPEGRLEPHPKLTQAELDADYLNLIEQIEAQNNE